MTEKLIDWAKKYLYDSMEQGAIEEQDLGDLSEKEVIKMANELEERSQAAYENWKERDI